MKTDHHELELQQFSNLVLDDDPALLAEILRTADNLQEQGKQQQAADVLQRLAKRLVPSDSLLPPLARCHVFARLGSVLANLRDFSQAEVWLRRAVALAEESRLTELSRRDFRRMLERLTEAKRESVAPKEPPRSIGESCDTRAVIASSADTIGLTPAEERRRQVLEELSEEQRQLIDLSKELSAEQIAERLGLSHTEVVSRLFVARARFRKLMDRLIAELEISNAKVPLGRSQASVPVRPR